MVLSGVSMCGREVLCCFGCIGVVILCGYVYVFSREESFVMLCFSLCG